MQIKLSAEQISLLKAPLPHWALKNHPTKKASGGKPMTVINPMAVVERLNEVFGVGVWHTSVVEKYAFSEIQKTKNGERNVWVATCKLILTVPEYNIHLEQYGGSTNDDKGDAEKGSATDALTKCASYLGIGASIYQGRGNGDGMPEKDFNDFMDIYIRRHKVSGDPGVVETMNSTQRYIYDYVRKSLARSKTE